jgi:carbon starvation protein CstA
MKKITCVFTLILMILVAAVFVSGPAELIAGMTPGWMNAQFWIIVIFLYFILATMLPVDKIIGKIYPLFAFALLFMAGGILVMLYVKNPDLPEIWNGFGTKYEKNPIFPMMFISIACGAISGFHGTQSPLMARCMKSERHCRPIFYGAMVAEGIVALVWAAAATCFFQENGIIDTVTGKAFSGAAVATRISNEWLGTFGGILALLGIVAAPITSGDTALRSARLIAADFLNFDQRPISKRLMICIPIFLITIGVLVYSLSDAEGFKIIWRYFAWCNQTLAVFTLWAITVYLVKEKKNFYISFLPALLMTLVCSTYICIAPEGLSLPQGLSYAIGGACTLAALIWFIFWYKKRR